MKRIRGAKAQPEATPPSVGVGVYEHFKGGHYLVLGIAEDSRDGKPLVIYVRLYSGDGIPMGARPVDDFAASVEGPDGPRPRFRFVGNRDTNP